MADVIETILGTCREINNSRTTDSVMDHLLGEVKELYDEHNRAVIGLTPGDDGVLGEGVDVILCVVDLIYKHNPNVTKEEILAVVVNKLAKWKRLYGNA